MNDVIMYVLISIVVAVVLIFAVTRSRGGKVTARWGNRSVSAEGQSPPGRIEVGNKANLKNVGAVKVAGVTGDAAPTTGQGGVSVAQEMKVEGAGDVDLRGIDVKSRTPERS